MLAAEDSNLTWFIAGLPQICTATATSSDTFPGRAFTALPALLRRSSIATSLPQLPNSLPQMIRISLAEWIQKANACAWAG
jgi:hypothetical protein